MLIFQKDDDKYRAWAEPLLHCGVETMAVSGSPIKAPFIVLDLICKRKKIQGYVFRYLNGYQSLLKDVIRYLSELLTILIVKSVRGDIFWIAHNVDRESLCYHDFISVARRFSVIRASKIIFVMDPLLEKYANDIFPKGKQIKSICFGRPLAMRLNDDTIQLHRTIKSLRDKLQCRYPEKTVYIGLCVSAASTKCIHFLSVCDFVERHSTSRVAVGMVVVGAVGQISSKVYQAARQSMIGNEGVELIDEPIQVRESYISGDVDFFYRVLDDLSVSYTLYIAADARRPMITESGTFLAEMVEAYALGGVALSHGPSTSDSWLHRCIKNWDPENAKRFLASRSWQRAAEVFYESIVKP